MPILYQKMIYRSDLMLNPGVWYVFGDNNLRVGMAGQAKEMRGMPNAIGVVTKRLPNLGANAFFTDDFYEDYRRLIYGDLTIVREKLLAEQIVVWPADGIGTGYSQLPQRAPRLWAWLESARQELEEI